MKVRDQAWCVRNEFVRKWPSVMYIATKRGVGSALLSKPKHVSSGAKS